MRSEGYSSRSFCLSVCRRLFWHYRLRDGSLAIPADSELREPEKYLGDFPESRDMQWKQAKKSLCVPWGLRKSQRMACIDSRMLSTTVAGPCLTLRGLLVEDHEQKHTNSRPSPSISSIAHAQFAEGLHFSVRLPYVIIHKLTSYAFIKEHKKCGTTRRRARIHTLPYASFMVSF